MSQLRAFLLAACFVVLVLVGPALVLGWRP